MGSPSRDPTEKTASVQAIFCIAGTEIRGTSDWCAPMHRGRAPAYRDKRATALGGRKKGEGGSVTPLTVFVA